LVLYSSGNISTLAAISNKKSFEILKTFFKAKTFFQGQDQDFIFLFLRCLETTYLRYQYTLTRLAILCSKSNIKWKYMCIYC